MLVVFSIGVLVSNGLSGQTPESDVFIEIVGKPEIPKDGSQLSDTLSLKFNLYKHKGTKKEHRDLFLKNLDNVQVTATEVIGHDDKAKPPTFIEGSLKKLNQQTTDVGNIPSDITISLLVDRSGSIDEEEMNKIRTAIRAFVDNVPDGCLFISWFHDDISESVQITKDNFEDAQLITSNLNTALYNAIYTKLLEFDRKAEIPNLEYEKHYTRNMEIAKRNSLNNYLIVLTDGVDDVENIPKYNDLESDMEIISAAKLNSTLKRYKNKVKVYTLGFGEDSDDFDEHALKRICSASGNPNGYFLATPDNILNDFKVRLTKELTPDYEIKFQNPIGKIYQGNIRTLTIDIIAPDSKFDRASGSVEYGMCSKAHQCQVGNVSVWGDVLKGLIAGVVFLLVVMIIIQLIIPLIKNKIFNIKHIKKYKPGENEIRKECPYCGDPINAGEAVVMKCKHIVHKACWGDFGHVCPEYGQNCNEGKQDYFDISDPFSKKNKKYYLKWVLFGLISGFLSWFIYMILKDSGLVESLGKGTLDMISPNLSDDSIRALFVSKIASLLLIGSLMGLFLTGFFSYIEEFRQKNMAIMLKIVLKAFLGLLFGFISFFLGSIILILLNKSYTSILFDWIPWVLFGMSIGLLLSIKTTIVWKHGMIGGLISIIFCFFSLYFMADDLGYPALLIGFMIYGGGLGFSIATVRSSAEQYFLKILQGKKHEETIPVHKWMSFQGGHNEVYIGSGFVCEIQMNWEKDNPEIAEKHAKMFINSVRNVPVIVSLEEGKLTVFDDRTDMKPGQEYDLFNGNTFKIGNTVFQYVEKDKSN